MASATLSAICTSFGTHCNLTHKNPKSPCSQTSNLRFFSPPLPSFSSQKLSSSHSILLLPKSSQSAPPVTDSDLEPEPTTVQSELGALESENVEIVEAFPDQPPQKEGVYAVVMIGSRQYIVTPGRWYSVQRLNGANINDKIALHKVLLVGTRTKAYVGKPVVTNAVIHATVEEQGLDPKVIVFKFKRKKHYQRTIGHRQPNTRIRINSITGYEDYPSVPMDNLKS